MQSQRSVPVRQTSPILVPTAGACACAGQIFGWEAMISFILVSVVYAVAIGSPSFGALSCHMWWPRPCAIWVDACGAALRPHILVKRLYAAAVLWWSDNQRQTMTMPCRAGNVAPLAAGLTLTAVLFGCEPRSTSASYT